MRLLLLASLGYMHFAFLTWTFVNTKLFFFLVLASGNSLVCLSLIPLHYFQKYPLSQRFQRAVDPPLVFSKHLGLLQFDFETPDCFHQQVLSKMKISLKFSTESVCYEHINGA